MSENVKPGETVARPVSQVASVVNGGNETVTSESARGSQSALNFAPPDTAGEVGNLGPYRVVKELGRGGMGAVFLAVDTRLKRKLALKVMLPEFAANTAAKERFLREARAAAQITHDNIVTVYEADERDGLPYIAMQFLQGYPLDEYLKKKGRPTIPQTLRIARETALGLAAAHRIHLVHRDIKPGNLWLEAPNGRVKILDFGLARPVDTEIQLTKSGAVVGTPAFMSPEQGRGQKVDHRSDLFSLGGVLYLLCTGQLPFPGPTVMAVLLALGHDEPKPVRELNPDVPEPLAELVHKLLAKNPDERPQTADEVAKQLRTIAESLAAPTASRPEAQAPQVVYVPVPVTAQTGQSAFAELDGLSPETEPEAPRPKPGKKKSGGSGLLIAAGLGAILAAVVVASVIIIIKHKDGTETKIEVPNGSTVKIDDKTGKPVVLVTPPEGNKPKPAPKVNPTPADPEREAARYILKVGGTVRINGNDREFKAGSVLPEGPFTVAMVWLRGNPNVTDDELAVFKDCKNVNHLDLTNTQITDKGLAHFAGCKNLGILDLVGSPIGDAGVAHFKGSKVLGSLWLGGTKVTDEGMAAFTDCKYLNHLDLTNTKVTDKGLECFEGNNRLLGLFLSGTSVSDKGLAIFKDCKNLTHLILNDTVVTDDGLAPFLECRGLKEVDVRNTLVTRKTIDAIKKNHPGCKLLSGGEPRPKAFKPTGGLEFDGKEARVDIPSLKLPSGPLTVEAWIAPTDSGEYHNVFSFGGDMECSLFVFAGNHTFRATTKEGKIFAAHVATKDLLPLHAKYPIHLAGVWDEKATRLFIQGRERAAVGASASTGATNLLKTAGTIGMASPTGEPVINSFKGVIYGVRVSTSARYSKDFTPAELTADADTLALYDFSERQGEKLGDKSGKNHHGKIIKAAWVK